MERTTVKILYHNEKKDETTKRSVFVTQDIKNVKASILGFDLSGLAEKESEALIKAYTDYQEKYYSNIPKFEEYLEAEKLSVEPKWRRFLKENIEIVD